MTSLQQAPAKGQQVPPPKMIDGVSEQQIDEAVKAHVRKGRAVASTVAASMSMQESAILAAVSYVEYRLNHLDDALLTDCSETSSMMASNVRFAAWVAMDELRSLRREAPATYDEADERVNRIIALCHCMARSYDMDDTMAAKTLAKLPEAVEAAFEVAEVLGLGVRS